MDRYVKGETPSMAYSCTSGKCYTLKELREAINGFVNLGAEMVILRLDPTMKNLERLGEVAEVIDDLRRNSAEVDGVVNKKGTFDRLRNAGLHLYYDAYCFSYRIRRYISDS